MTRIELNRALLARQMLLTREKTDAVDVIGRLVAMQAQQPRPPFTGLWTRIDGFVPPHLIDLLKSREVVRATLLRGTLHLLRSVDYQRLRSSIQPCLTAGMQSIVKTRGAAFDVDAICSAARQEFQTTPRTFNEVRATLMEHFPGVDERAMGYAARTMIPLVMVPENDECGFDPDSKFTTSESWLKCPIEVEDRTEELILRYLAAFGPATVADAQAWSGLGKLKPYFESLRPRLQTFRDEKKRELFDIPDAPRPDAGTPAPVRFLPGFDNIVLGHADRSRILAEEHRTLVVTKNLQVLPTFLVDGFVAGTWDATLKKASATITLKPFGTIPTTAKKALEAEGERLAAFLAPGASRHEVAIG